MTTIPMAAVLPVIMEANTSRYTIHVKTNQMYEYVISEGKMMKLFLTEYNTIQEMTEKEFIDWFKAKLIELAYYDDDVIEEFDVKEI